MISLAKCRSILSHDYDESLTDEQIKNIRDKMYFLANIEYSILNQSNYEESNNLHQSKYRRAS